MMVLLLAIFIVAGTSLVDAGRCESDEVVSRLIPTLSSPDLLITRCSAPAAFGKAVQGWQAPGHPEDYGLSPAAVVQPRGKHPTFPFILGAIETKMVTKEFVGRCKGSVEGRLNVGTLKFKRCSAGHR